MRYGTDINTPDALDTDGDGVIDQIEVLQGTDLSDAASFLDTDKDGVPDFVELSQGTSPHDENNYLDSDNDGVANYTELNQNSDPNDEKSYLDSDGDSVPDSLEVQFGGAIDVADAIDSDGDGVNDYREVYFGVDDEPVWVIDLNNIDSNMSEYHFDVPDEVTKIQLPFVAFELDGQDINYSLAGEDAAQFIVSGEGALSLVSKLSSLNPIDMNSDGIYSLSLIASDGINDSPILLSINLIPSIDTDGDSIFDVYDDDDDNDLVPDDIEIEQGTDPLDSDSYLDEDQNGEADFIQISNAEYINYDFPLGVTIDEGSYAIIDLTQITSVNGSVNIVVNEVDGLNYKFRDNTIYIYADYIEQDTTIELVISMTDGVETIEHTFPISVVNVAIEKAKIELIREAKVIKGALKVQVASKGISNGAEVQYLWYLGDMNNPIIGNDIMELTVNDFIDDVMVVKVEVSADSFETVYSDIIELSRDEFESGQDGNGEESISAENVAGTFSLFAVMLLVVLGAYRRYLSGTALLALLAAISITGCASSNSDNKSTNIALSESIKTIQLSFDDRDPLYQAKLEFEANKERLRKEEEARRIAQEKRERAERTHISTIGF